MEFLREPFRQIKNRRHSRSPSRKRSKGAATQNASVSELAQTPSGPDDEVLDGYGLLLLNPDSGTNYLANCERIYEVDIVAVHGLGGRRLKTWRNDRGEIWLQKWLPDAVPGAKVYTYGYASDPIFSSSRLGIEDFARGLLNDLTFSRPSGKQPRRLVFICHSLGGIVCKRALLMARENPRYSHIYEQTLAILFFGTPHRGAEKADLITTVAAILNASEVLTRRPALRKDLIETLRPDSLYLENISEAFSHRIKDFEIVTFYEGNLLPPYKTELVPRSSAFIHDEIKIPMDGNHHQICKFDSETCYEYQKVVQNIRQILDKLDTKLQTLTPIVPAAKNAPRIEPTLTPDEDNSDILNTIDTSEISYYKENLPRPVDGTCKWLVEDALFLSWLNQKPSSLLWITGHAGCGKSMLAAFMVDYLKSQSRIPATVCYFFVVDNIDHQNNGLSILRSIIAQFLRQRRDLMHHARKIVRRRQLHRLEALWDLFIKLVGDVSAGITTVIIDALDECNEESRSQLLRLIGRIFDRRSSDVPLINARLKLVITSRRDPFLEMKLSTLPIIRLDLENHNAVRGAIRLYIHAKVAELMHMSGYNKDTARFIENELQEKAENTYLWIKLVLESMERAMSERGGASIKDFQQIVKSLPHKVQSVYASMLQSIRDAERSHAAQLLRIITTSFRPLTIRELNTAVQVLKWHSTTLSELNEETQGNFERALDCLRGFVRVADSRIYLVHQSAKDFLTSLSEQPVPGIPPEFGVLSAEAHLALADACISFLMIREFEQPLFEVHATDPTEFPSGYRGTNREDQESGIDDDKEFGLATLFGDDVLSRGVEQVALMHTFFDYAALNWAKHFTVCEGIASSELIKKYILISTKDGTHRLMNWLRYLWYSKTYDPCPEYFEALIVAAYFGHGRVLKHLLRTQGVAYPPKTKNLAISWASRMGHAQVVETLLAEGADANSKVDGWTPLAWATHFGYLDVARILARSGKVFLNIKDWKGRTPLSLAAAGGYLDIVKALSSLEGVVIDTPDIGGVTPLFKAVTEGHFEVVHWMLQDGKSNVNHQDETGQTMLFSAAEYGFIDVVKLLLNQERLNPNLKDKSGHSTLSWAAAKASLAIVQTIARDKRVDLHSFDHLGRSALCWACWSSDTRVVEFFAAIDPDNVDLPATDDGCTPLHFLVVAGRTHAAHSIRTLLATGSVDIDKKDLAGRTALSHAASGGQLELVQVLVENGADMDSVDVMGMSPLDWAKSVNAESVAQYLQLQRVANLEVSGTQGPQANRQWKGNEGLGQTKQ